MALTARLKPNVTITDRTRVIPAIIALSLANIANMSLFVAPNALLRKDTARYDKEFFALLYRIVSCDQRAASVAGFGYEYRMRQRAYYPIALRKVILQRLCTHRVFADYQSLIDNLLLQI